MPVLNIALIAHDGQKHQLVEWIGKNISFFEKNILFATGTTGRILQENYPTLGITKLKSGPLGGDQEVGQLIANEKLHLVIFLVDGLSVQPHDSDVRALTRLAVLYNVPLTMNLSTADLIISNNDIASGSYNHPEPIDFSKYLNRKI